MLYSTTSAFVYPSFFEGFGFPPLEAQACGAPVISANRTSLPEVLGNSALLVDPWRIEELAISIEAVLEDEPLRNLLVDRGFKNSSRFRWENTAESLIDLFNSVV